MKLTGLLLDIRTFGCYRPSLFDKLQDDVNINLARSVLVWTRHIKPSDTISDDQPKVSLVHVIKTLQLIKNLEQ